MSDPVFYGILIGLLLLITIGCSLLIRSAARAKASDEFRRRYICGPLNRKRLP